MSDQDEPTVEDVEAAAMRFLGRRDYGREELARKLRKRDFPEVLIEEVLDGYEEAGYLDDLRFATEQGAILARKSWGPIQIMNKLRSRGIEESVIDEALVEIRERQDFRERAGERMASRFGEAEAMDRDEKAKAYRHLTYRGYSPAMVRGLIFGD